MTKTFSHEQIAQLAYKSWERRGRPLGSPEIDWHTAESALGMRDLPEPFSPLSVLFEPEETAYRES
jgi:Protein of unknown function (DUF2934)